MVIELFSSFVLGGLATIGVIALWILVKGEGVDD